MKESYLLKTDGARGIYREIMDLPIIDFHNHVALSDLSAERTFDNIYELWIKSDPYKHRLMRISGIPEKYITGDAEPREKFRKYAEIFPYLAGNPVYDWSRMELSMIFGIDELLSGENSDRIYDECTEMLTSGKLSGADIISKFNIEYQSPVATLFDDLSGFDKCKNAPSLRGDNLLYPTDELKSRLEKETGIAASDSDSYVKAVAVYLDKFDACGCRFADHAIDAEFFENDTDGIGRVTLIKLANEYAKRGWTLLLHLDAKRKTSDRLAKAAGPAGGYAAVGGNFPISSVCDLLNSMEASGGLPDTVLFPLNMSDQAPLAVMQGSFSEDGTPSKVQLGPAWWWCDHKLGIENTLDAISSFGVLSEFIGMTTDSRSILSFVRHDYFRRILASYIDKRNTECEWDLPFDVQCEIARKICYENAREKIRR